MIILQLPGQLAAALKNRLLQHVLSCRPDEAVALRLNLWLRHTLHEGIQPFIVMICYRKPKSHMKTYYGQT